MERAGSATAATISLQPNAALEVPMLTVAAVALLGLIAAATSLSSVYGSNSTFGTGWNYLALFTSAAGSSAISGILATLLLLSGKPA